MAGSAKLPRRHHYLPRFYLNGFLQDSLLWVYDADKPEVRQQSVDSTAVQSFYYSIEDDRGYKQPHLETALSIVEGQAAGIIHRLLVKETISKSEKDTFSLFVALLMNRVPDFEKSYDDAMAKLMRRIMDMLLASEASAQSLLDRMRADTGREPDITGKELFEFNRDGEFDLSLNRNASLKAMVQLSTSLAFYFRQMDWAIFHASAAAPYITSDNPVIVVPPNRPATPLGGSGIIEPGAKKILPLSRLACLVMYDHGERIEHRNAEPEAVAIMNQAIATSARQLLISGSQSVLRNNTDFVRPLDERNMGRYRVM